MNIDDINNYPKTNNLTACYRALLCLENERSCIFVLGISIFFCLFLRFWYLILKMFRQCSNFCFSLYCEHVQYFVLYVYESTCILKLMKVYYITCIMYFIYFLFHGYLHFQQYFSYIMAVSLIGGGNWSTRKNHLPVASHWQTVTWLCTPHPNSSSQHQWW